MQSHAGWFSNLFKSTYTKTKHPIVLAHGLLGWEEMLGIEYWYKIPAKLKKDGATVYTTKVSAVHSSEFRGEQLIVEIENILAVSGASKVNLIGHSHGGPTIRYVAAVRPDLVASVTTVGGVNKGSNVADWLRDTASEGSTTEAILVPLIEAVGTVIDFVSGNSGNEQDALASLGSMTTEGSNVFNALYPAGIPDSACGEGDYKVNGIRYYSWSGGKQVTNILDPMDLITTIAGLTFDGSGEVNDGFVGSCDSNLGQVIRNDYSMNHLDESNLLFGLHDIFSTDPLTMFRNHANRLKKAGL